MLFRIPLRRLSIAAVVVLSLTGFGITFLPAVANAVTAPIMEVISISRTAAQPNRISGVIYTDEAPPGGLVVVFHIKVSGVNGGSESVAFEPNAKEGQFNYPFVTTDFQAALPPSKPLPKGTVNVSWGIFLYQFQGAWPSQDHGELTLNAVGASSTTTTSPSGGSVGTGTLTPTIPVSGQVVIGGILRDQAVGAFNPGSLKETFKKGKVVSIAARASFKSSTPSAVNVVISLSRKSASTPWGGKVVVGDTDVEKHIDLAFARNLTVVQAKNGRLTGKAMALVVRDGKARAKASLSWSINSP